MKRKSKHYDIKRIIGNAMLLMDPVVYECFIYECEDPDEFAQIEDEIEEFKDVTVCAKCRQELAAK